MIQFGYRTPGLKALSFREKVQLAADLGLPVIEVARTEFASLEDCKELKGASAELGVEVTSMGGAMGLCNPDSPGRDPGTARVRARRVRGVGC